MFGLFHLFGRSSALKAVDHALRQAGLHPLLVPEAVKLTILRLHKTEIGTGTGSREAVLKEAAQLFAYCMLGRDQFTESNDCAAAAQAGERLEAAIAAGDSPDAQIVLLALHSGLIDADIAALIDVDQE